MNSKTYKSTRRVLSMMRDVNSLNNGNANILVPKSEVLSAKEFDFLSIHFFLDKKLC